MIVAETPEAMALLDIHPCAPGHTLVIPKVHVTSLSELPENMVPHLFGLARKMATRLNEVLKPDGLTIGINQGTGGHQGLPHLHVHLLPRYLDDSGGSVHTIVKNPPQESLVTMVEKIKL